MKTSVVSIFMLLQHSCTDDAKEMDATEKVIEELISTVSDSGHI